MKFSNTASTAALAGLALLVSAVYGVIFDCGSITEFDYDTIMHYVSLATSDGMRVRDPPYFNGKVYGSYYFTKNINNEERSFLVQSVEAHPFYRFFDLTVTPTECELKDKNAQQS
ncbi:BgTH12-07830 [Blumeria graminis f. sp. triticale]|uniref:BgTH12-07830 n=1 Tax=Blumeria graminis f. sp. triticale TaxID=1689686 RepID=A0A9W4GID9_BLUGR|nr:BgTH12-07830 [Blumeria graminis f. sp. triticale]